MLDRTIKLLEMATHPQTSDAEALNAVRMFRAQVDREGGITTALSASGPSKSVAAHVPYAEKLTRIRNLESEKKALETVVKAHLSTIHKLEMANSTLKDQITELKSRKNLASGMPFDQFMREVVIRIGGMMIPWEQAFENQTKLSAEPFYTVFKTEKRVSSEYVEALSLLTKSSLDKRAWSLEQVEALRKFHNKGYTDDIIAQKLTEQFGFFVTERMVQIVKAQSRTGSGMFINDIFGGPMQASRGRKAILSQKSDSFPWKQFPEANAKAARMLLTGQFRMAQIAKTVQDATGVPCNEFQVTNHFYNGPPPIPLGVKAKAKGQPTDWAELWLLSANVVKGKGWVRQIRRALNIPSNVRIGQDPNPHLNKVVLDSLREQLGS